MGGWQKELRGEPALGAAGSFRAVRVEGSGLSLNDHRMEGLMRGWNCGVANLRNNVHH